MAIFRKIHTSFWSDTFIQDLDNDQKLFYLYLLTNERTKQCGIYEISKKQICFDLGYSMDKVSKLLLYFIKRDRILYSEVTKELAIKNWNKFNSSNSPKVVSCIKSELLSIKDRVLIEYVNGMYIASQEEEEKEEEQEEEQEEKKEEIDYFYLLEYLNKTFDRKFKIISEDVKKKYQARLKDGYTIDDIITAINNCKKNKFHIENNFQYCTPEFFSKSTTLEKYSDVTIQEKKVHSSHSIIFD